MWLWILTRLTEVIILQCMQISNHHVVPETNIMVYVNYISINLWYFIETTGKSPAMIEPKRSASKVMCTQSP